MSEQKQHANGDGPASVDQKFLDLYSRQIGTYGMDTMVRLISLRVLILGLRGVGAEAAKNLALAGVHTVGLHDAHPVEERDLGLNFCCTDVHVSSKATRAEATAALIRQLNPNTRIRVVAALTDEELHAFDVVIVTSAASPHFSTKEFARINDVCRARKPHPASFIACFSGGALGSVFVDHGPNFVVKDLDGREVLQKSIEEVGERVDKKGRKYTRLHLAVPEGMRPGALRDRTEVTFSDVEGLVHKETGKSINAATTPFHGVVGIGDAPNTLRLYPSLEELGYGPYINGGFVHECKERVTIDFRTFKEALSMPPAIITTDSMMDGTAERNVHLMLSALLSYGDRHRGALPAPATDGVAVEQVLAIAREVQAQGEDAATARAAAKQDEPQDAAPAEEADSEMPAKLPPPPPPEPFKVDHFDEAFVKRAASLAGVELQPLSTLLGAIVAQEVVKVTGKFTPITQFLHLNVSSVLPDNAPTDAHPKGDRYDDLRGIFGNAFVEKLQNLKMFMVGCGALGCEYLKNFALTGVCCGANGMLTVTDNDRIEVSNLNRQFLFREDNVGQQKSLAAANRVKSMNKHIKIDARQDFVADTTEHLFPDEFWMKLDVVTNALDNMTARLFVDDKCILFEKVLVEAGTMGTGGNVDIVVPRKTTSYGEGGAADETGGIPMCTLRNFPYIFDHCIEWARAQFEDLFVAPIMMTQQLRENPTAFRKKVHDEVLNQDNVGLKRSMLNKNLKTLKALVSVGAILTKSEITMLDCFSFAWFAFHSQFRDRIESLVRALPIDAKKKHGEPFWSGHRKFPHVLTADLSDADVRDFLISATNLFACMLGVHGPKHPPVKNDPQHRWHAEYRTAAWIHSIADGVPVPPVELTTVDDLDDETSSSTKTEDVADETLEKQFLALLKDVETLGKDLAHSSAVPLEFEKDDDDNFHIDFVAAAANLRARNYRIPTKDRLAVKLVAGKIIPAVATTTAAVTGIALIELFKVLQEKDVSLLRNGMVDLGVNNYTMFERDPPKKVKSFIKKTYDPESDYTLEEPQVAFPNPHTNYDKIIIDVDKTTTVSDFVDALVAKTEGAEEGPYEVVSLGVGRGMIWNGMPGHKHFKLPLLQCIAEQLEVDATQFWSHRRMYHRLAVNMETSEGNEVTNATVVVRIASA